MPAAEARLTEADERWRDAEAEAARRRARLDALDLALGEARPGPVPRRSPTSTASPARSPTTSSSSPVPKRRSPPAWATRSKPSCSKAATRPAARSSTSRPATRARSCSSPTRSRPVHARRRCRSARVRSPSAFERRPDLAPVLERLLAGIVLVEGGWRPALDTVLAHRDVVVVTRDGDRLGGSGPWRLGSGTAPAVTQAALEDAAAEAAAAETARRRRGRARAEAIAQLEAIRASSTRRAGRARRRRGRARSARRPTSPPCADLEVARRHARRAVGRVDPPARGRRRPIVEPRRDRARRSRATARRALRTSAPTARSSNA